MLYVTEDKMNMMLVYKKLPLLIGLELWMKFSEVK